MKPLRERYFIPAAISRANLRNMVCRSSGQASANLKGCDSKEQGMIVSQDHVDIREINTSCMYV